MHSRLPSDWSSSPSGVAAPTTPRPWSCDGSRRHNSRDVRNSRLQLTTLTSPTRYPLGVPIAWQPVREFQDIIYEQAEGIAKITINRPEVRNAFRPETIFE